MTVIRKLASQRSAALALAVVAGLVLLAVAAPLITWIAGSSPTA